MVKIIFFTTLVLFPFGQIFKIGIINFFDVSILLLAIFTLFKKPKYPNWYRYFIYFIFACIFSLLMNYQIINVKGVLYLIRLIAYSFVAIYVANFDSQIKINSLRLVLIAIATATFGWIQYLIWPDLTSLKYLGWDDHLMRMVGTFFDPTYLGLILVLGVVIALRYNLNWAFYFLALSILVTYSRVSYLLLFLLTIFHKKYIALVLLILVLFILPKNIGEGTNLTRTSTVKFKIENYSETFKIIKKSPLFGVGFNNICSARKLYLGESNYGSHSCNGSDSSLLFLISTTGVVGLILFGYVVYSIWYIGPSRDVTYYILLTTFVAVLIHSQFANSLFYPHVMFWLYYLIGLQTKIEGK